MLFSVGCIPTLKLKEQQGLRIISQGEDTDTRALQKCRKYARKQPAAPTAQGISRGEAVCDYIHHCCDMCGLEWQKTFAEPGQWSVGQRELPVRKSVRRCQQVTSAHMNECDLQSTSGKASVQRGQMLRE